MLSGIHNQLHVYVASHGAPGDLGVPYHINHVIYGRLRPFLGDTLWTHHV